MAKSLPKWIRTAAWLLVFGLALLTCIFAIARTQEVVATAFFEHPASTDPFDERYNRFPYLSLLHVVPGLAFFLVGPFQFVGWIRERHISVHRWMGRTYVVLGTVAAITSILMAHRFPAFGGVGTATATYLFGSLFLVCLALALRHVLRGDIVHHREWMIRGFAIALGVSSIRLAVLFFAIFSDLTFMEIFPTSFWLGFTVNLMVAEIWINLTRGTPQAAW